MSSIRYCQNIFANQILSDEYFLDLHISIESYLKRILFIGLRKNDVKYKMAQDAIIKYYEPLPVLIEKAWTLIGIDYKNDVQRFGNYKAIEDYFLNFTSKYRNYRVHGVYDEIRDPVLLQCLILFDKAFIDEIDSFLISKKLPKVFDEPNQWGARTVRSSAESIENIFDRLLGGKKNLKKPKYLKSDAQKALKNLGIWKKIPD